ncbi:hypothetical protein PM082_014334 [Marasmius tenuissimus]|nr:hypothetical protein PM082_014334 [Marasmius tenuissimus]
MQAPVTSPVLRLSHDVLAHIFCFLANAHDNPIQHSCEGEDTDCEEYRAYCRPPWLLGLVCRSWRCSALSLPLLWTNFNLKCFSSSATAYEFDIEKLTVQLKRCQGHPVRVDLEGLDDSDPHEVTVSKFLSVLLSPSNRISSCFLSLGAETFYSLHHGFNPLGFPDLEEIIIKNNDDLPLEYILRKTERFSVFQNCPKLRSFSILGHNDLKQLDIPWSQITTYISRNSDDFFAENHLHYEVLSRLENLETCWLDCVIIDGNAESDYIQPPRVLRHLHTLILSSAANLVYNGYDKSGISHLLDSVTLPSLHTLKFRNSLRESSSSLVKFIDRSRCTLRKLTLFDVIEQDLSDVESLLRSGSLESLETLSIGFRIHPPPFDVTPIFSVLGRSPETRGHRFPHLRCFETSCWEPFKQPGLIGMVRSRCGTDGGELLLKRLVLQAHKKMTKNESKEWRELGESEFAEFCDEGLVVEWVEKTSCGIEPTITGA